VRGWGSFSILVVMLASGPVARAIPNSTLVWLLASVALAGAASTFLALRRIEGVEPAADHPEAHLKLSHPLLAAGVIAAASLVQSSHATAYAFASLHWKAEGFDETFVALAWIVSLVTEVGFFLAARRWLGGEARAATHLALGGFAAALRWAVMASDPGGVGILAAQSLHGLSCAAVQLGPAYLLARLCGATRLAQAQGWLAAANAATLSVATLASGPLYARYGEAAYLAMAAMATTGGALAFALSRALPAPGR
jgi:PPP family 3-phenylpropionic acid transporter